MRRFEFGQERCRSNGLNAAARSAPEGENRNVLASIEDTGMGIDPKNIDRIFDAFFTTKSEGMGVGLAICRSLIEAHGGRLWASSDVDHGSVFNILLPASDPDLNNDQMLKAS